MDTTEILMGFLFFLLLVVLIPVGLAYLAEWYTQKALQSYAKFQNARGKLESFEKDLSCEASKWPIYARPVLFTSIDKRTQKTFGIAQQALDEAQRISKEFPSVLQRPSGTLEAFSPVKCAKRIQLCDEIIRQEAEISKWLHQLEDGKRALVQHYKEENVTVKEVESQLAALKKRLAEAEKRVAAISHGAEFNETIGWVINYAQIGTQASEARVSAPKEKGLLNYAIAATFICLTNYLLEHFDLSEREISFSGKFVLDRFKNRLKDFEISLRKVVEAKAEDDKKQLLESKLSSIPEMAQNKPSGNITKFAVQTVQKLQQGYYQQATNAIETWDDVTLLDSLLVVLREKLERARLSFSFFLKTQAILLDLIQKITTSNIPQLRAESSKLENECEKYWGALVVFPLHWKEALKGSDLPSVEFNIAKELFQTEILQYVQTNAQIKQSEMTKIISKMTCYLAKVESGKMSFKKLSMHLKLHKDAEIAINARLGDNGTTGKIIRDMENFKGDYSEENRLVCIRNRDEYSGFQSRARKITGANFPAMLGELDVFEKKCRSLIAKHDEEIKKIHQQCENNSKGLRARRNALELFKEAVPKINYDFQAIEAKINATLQKDYMKNINYQWLQGYLKEINDVMGDADQALNQLNAYWGRFDVAEKNAFELLTQNQAVLVLQRKVTSEKLKLSEFFLAV